MKMWKWQLRLCNMNYCLFISVTGAWTKALSTPTSKWRIAQWTTRTWSFPTARTVGRRVNCGGFHQIHFGRIEKHSILMYHLQDSEGGGCINILNSGIGSSRPREESQPPTFQYLLEANLLFIFKSSEFRRHCLNFDADLSWETEHIVPLMSYYFFGQEFWKLWTLCVFWLTDIWPRDL